MHGKYWEMVLIFILFFGSISGLAGAFAMTGFMLKVSSTYSKRVDMIQALGSYFTGRIDGSSELGKKIHALSGIFFGILYFAIMHLMGAFAFPYPIFLGIGFGFFHGLTNMRIRTWISNFKFEIQDACFRLSA